MSEYQFVHFLAVDRPLDDKQIEFMEKQSTRAKVSRWEFTNEYHFGDFRGDELEMLRRGYDLHLHFANFGVRTLAFRLPQGLPCDKRQFEQFCPESGVTWYRDKKGPGGILEVQPEAEGDSFGYADDVSGVLEGVAPVRAMLMSGDLRPLYLFWLACGGPDEELEPPVPAGLSPWPEALVEAADFYELSEDLLTAAAELSPPAPDRQDESALLASWMEKQNVTELRSWVARLLGPDAAGARAEVLTLVRKQIKEASWPVAPGQRTRGQLRAREEVIAKERRQNKAKAAAAARTKRLQELAKDPRKAIERAREIFAKSSSDEFTTAAKLLADLREALGLERGDQQVRKVVEEIRATHAKRPLVISALRKQGLIPKKGR